jgi:NAD(P)-dependent dehydrogenase (short-subunit alcohol dehydrogenase family)
MPSVLITGTSKGIGFEAALAFGRAGHQVHATMRNPSKSPQLAEIAASENLPITISTMDVDSDSSVRDAIAAILKDHGPIDILVNNAGIESVGSVEESQLSEFRATMETNYFGALRCIQALLPQMRQRRSGCIINISSVSGQISTPPLTAYCASKWALEALSEGLAGEIKTFNIRVALVEPGIIDTAMARRIGDPATGSPYTQTARFGAVFSNSLQNPVPPSLVAQKILDVAESGTWQLRHPVGPDAIPLLQFRNQMTDEEWIDVSAGSDANFFARLSQMGAAKQ